ncbi:MAG TPA: glycosyl transferase family 1, partial [Conexibacter sp.]|nr:glycosyl transferase family 1 [Conexibacter sp.]
MAASPLNVQLVDPSAFTPPYDHALAGALARVGGDEIAVELVTSRFAYGDVPRGEGYAMREAFYRWAPGGPGSRTRRAAKLAQHVPDMLRFAASRGARRADVVHFQWLTVQP